MLLGIGVGALLQRALDRRSVQHAKKDSATEIPTEDKLSAASDVEILRAWRTLSGKLWLQMDGARLNEKESLRKDQRRRLVTLFQDLRPWVEKVPAADVPPEIHPEGVVQAVPLDMKGKPDAEQVKPVPVLKSIVEQIDDVLQANLADSPFTGRDIHLTEGPGGMVLVKYGLRKFEGIEAVPEPEIRAFIRQAVTDWEKSEH